MTRTLPLSTMTLEGVPTLLGKLAYSPHYRLHFELTKTIHYRYRAVVDFLERNKLLSVIRAHEAQDAG